MITSLLRRLRRLSRYLFGRPIVRVWRLGSLEHRLYPTTEAINHLAKMLLDAPVDHDLDVIWGPDLDVIELKGTGELNIVASPGIRVTRDGNVVKVELEREEGCD